MSVSFIGELYTVVVASLGILNAALGIYIWTSRRIPGALVGGGIALVVAEICLMFHLMTNTASPEAGFQYARLRFLGLSLVNPLMLIFFLQYTRQTQWLKPPLVASLFIIPVLTQVVLWFTPSHEQFFGGWRLVLIGGYGLESHDFRGWYHVHGYYHSILFLLSLALLTWYMRRVDSSRRRELYLLAALAIFAALGASDIVSLGPAPGFKVTPISLGVVSLGMLWVLIGGSVQRVMPVAYDLIFESISDAVVVLDPAGHIIKANPAAARLLGTSPTASVNRSFDAAMAAAEGWTAHRAGEAAFDVLFGPDDGRARFEVRRLPLRRGQHDFGELVVMRDVTAERLALESEVERQRSQILANFINHASHEFRTPLSIIKSSAYLLGRQDTGANGARHLTKINDQADRINNLVDDLQMMAMLDGGAPLSSEPMDLGELTRSAVDGFAIPQAGAKGQAVSVSIEPGLPILRGDSDEMTLAIRKVLHNAIRYTPDAGRIDIAARRAGGGVVLTIADTGVGMDLPTAQASTQRFYRLDSARTSAGFGLGLPIARKIVERHGGTLAINSAPTQGTTVVITLPDSGP